MGNSSVDYHRSLFYVARWPLLLYGVLALFYLYQSKFILFSWHPMLMVVSFISLAGNAALIKKIGGYENTKTHGILMTLASILAGAGWYVIHTNKNLNNRKHLLTLHGKMGAAVVTGYFLVGIAGFVLLHPDYGIMKSSKEFRLIHKWGGRFMIAAAWITSVLGFMKLQNDLYIQLAAGIPLVLLGLFVLL